MPKPSPWSKPLEELQSLLTLYHVTPASNLPDILRYGLQPRPGGTFKDPKVGIREARIYLTVDAKDVLAHALKYVGDWAVLEVQVNKSSLHSDPYEVGHYYSTKEIPPKSVKLIGMYRSA